MGTERPANTRGTEEYHPETTRDHPIWRSVILTRCNTELTTLQEPGYGGGTGDHSCEGQQEGGQARTSGR